MPSAAQSATSRANGRRSHGAITASGRDRIVAANLRSGVYAKAPVLPWEDPADRARLTREYYDHHRPATALARELVDRLIECEWLLRRFNRIEGSIGGSTFPRLQHRINATRRAFFTALHGLEHLPRPAGPLSAAPLPGTQPRTKCTLRTFPAAQREPQRPRVRTPVCHREPPRIQLNPRVADG